MLYVLRIYMAAVVFLFSAMTVNADVGVSRLLDKHHGTFIDSCKNLLTCKQADIDGCIATMRKAFNACDKEFYKAPDGNAFPDCIAQHTTALGTTLIIGVNSQNCSPENAIPYRYVSEASNPPDHPQLLEFFTQNTFDWSNIVLYQDKKEMCKQGAIKAKAAIDKDGIGRANIEIKGFRKLYNLVAGDNQGDLGYAHVFSTPAYEWGECYGVAKTEILVSNGAFKKGEIISAEYTDRIFVAVQCHKEPMPKQCEKQ